MYISNLLFFKMTIYLKLCNLSNVSTNALLLFVPSTLQISIQITSSVIKNCDEIKYFLECHRITKPNSFSHFNKSNIEFILLHFLHKRNNNKLWMMFVFVSWHMMYFYAATFRNCLQFFTTDFLTDKHTLWRINPLTFDRFNDWYIGFELTSNTHNCNRC